MRPLHQAFVTKQLIVLLLICSTVYDDVTNLKFIDLSNIQKSNFFRKNIIFPSNKTIHSLYIKGYVMAKNNFLAEVTVENTKY